MGGLIVFHNVLKLGKRPKIFEKLIFFSQINTLDAFDQLGFAELCLKI